LDSQSKDIPKCQSELAENHKRITEDMAKIGVALEKEIDQLQKAGEDIVKNNLRFTSANCNSLESAGLLASLNRNLFTEAPLKATLGLDALFGFLNRDIFVSYEKNMREQNSMTLRFKTQLDQMNAVYNQCRENDNLLFVRTELPMHTLERVSSMRAQLDSAVETIETGDLAAHTFTKAFGTDLRQQLKQALTQKDSGWPRTPLQEMRLLISQRLDRLEARARAQQADLDAHGSQQIYQEDIEAMLGSEFGDEENALVSEDLRATERQNIMFNQRPQELE
jgi:hypothetical protein